MIKGDGTIKDDGGIFVTNKICNKGEWMVIMINVSGLCEWSAWLIEEICRQKLLVLFLFYSALFYFLPCKLSAFLQGMQI